MSAMQVMDKKHHYWSKKSTSLCTKQIRAVLKSLRKRLSLNSWFLRQTTNMVKQRIYIQTCVKWSECSHLRSLVNYFTLATTLMYSSNIKLGKSMEWATTSASLLQLFHLREISPTWKQKSQTLRQLWVWSGIPRIERRLSNLSLSAMQMVP